MARKTVRVNIPSSKPEALLRLGQAAVATHKAKGANSPLDDEKMKLLDRLVNGQPATADTPAVDGADQKNQSAKLHDAAAQTDRQARDILLGIADGQTSDTKGTALNLLGYVRDELLVVSDGNDEALGEWGFDVVVGTAKSPTKKAPKP